MGKLCDAAAVGVANLRYPPCFAQNHRSIRGCEMRPAAELSPDIRLAEAVLNGEVARTDRLSIRSAHRPLKSRAIVRIRAGEFPRVAALIALGRRRGHGFAAGRRPIVALLWRPIVTAGGRREVAPWRRR